MSSSITPAKASAFIVTHSASMTALATILAELVNVVPLNQSAKAKIGTALETVQVGIAALDEMAEGIAAFEAPEPGPKLDNADEAALQDGHGAGTAQTATAARAASEQAPAAPGQGSTVTASAALAGTDGSGRPPATLDAGGAGVVA